VREQVEQEPFVDEEMEPDPELKRLTNAIIGAAIEVHRHLGPGFAQSVYEAALAIEFESRGITVSRQHRFDVRYKGVLVGEGFLDFLVEGKVVVELKAVDSLASVHTSQVISYLRATHHKLALLINFNTKLLKDGVRRVSA
jgi:GxxExxY protein